MPASARSITGAAGGAAPARIALFDYGFRPFFLLAPAYGAASLLAWVGIFSGALRLPVSWPEALWHGHEMIYGFAAAGLAGFLLTAVPNWTDATPLRGGRLAVLVLLWAAGRIAMWLCAAFPAPAVAVIDLAFLPCLAAGVGHALIGQMAKTGFRNIVFLGLLTLLWLGNVLVHLDVLGILPGVGITGLHLGVDVLLTAIVLVGGRIIPAFTTNALRQAGVSRKPRSISVLDALAIATMLALLAADALAGSAQIIAGAASLAAMVTAVRLALWRPLATRHSPLLWVLHLGYGWLVAGLALKGASGFTGLPPSAALHALTAGAIATMLLAVMSRASLGHTGRPLIAPPAAVIAYASITTAALLRVAAPLVANGNLALLTASGILWAAAMALFAAVYAPILIRPRIDGKPG